MNIFIVGASGATGKHLVKLLLENNNSVTAVVRSPEKLPDYIKNHPEFTSVTGTVLDMPEEQLARILVNTDAVASCLGHNLHLKGLYGKPRKLVTDTANKICSAIKQNKPSKPVKFVLMNTAGNVWLENNEKTSIAEKLVLALIRFLVPPHSDNEHAARFFSNIIKGDNKTVEWVIVRPDSLLDAETVTEYSLHPSPVTSAIFKPGKTSRINVAHFMKELIVNSELWSNWKFRWPVIYNKE